MAKIKGGGSMAELVDIERVLTGLKRVAATALNEEEFKINAERILYNEVISKLGLQPGRYEYTFISGGRLNALYGHVLIEYKAPSKLSRPSDIASAKEQLIGYIVKEAHRLVTEGKVEQLRKVEEEVDTQVAKLYGLTNKDLKEIKKSLAIFEGRGEMDWRRV